MDFPAYYHTYIVPTGHFNTRDIFVFITIGNMHSIMAMPLLLITASRNVVPQKKYSTLSKKTKIVDGRQL